nr:PLP-dependent aminotransferase family protein [Fodinicola acaciae]
MAEAIRGAITESRLPAGARLPATRTLAADLACSRWVVTEAYQVLLAEGVLTATVGSGTRVAATGNAAAPPRTPVRTEPRFDLRPGVPELTAFPRAAWLTAMGEALSGTPRGTLRSSDPAGSPQLRHLLAGYLARTRGVRVGPAELVVTSGVTHAVSLLSHVLANNGAKTVAIEDPGWPRLPAAVTEAGLATHPVPVDENGLRVRKLGDEAAVIVSPAHQFPQGVVLSRRRRDDIVAWARKTGALVIEDDYDAQYRFDNKPVGALQPEDPGRVCYVGSVSKTLSPAIRIGWLVAPATIAAAVTDRLLRDGSRPSTLEQLAFARLVESGAYDRHLRRTWTTYRRRRDTLVAEIARQLPGATVRGVAAGLHLVVEFARQLDEYAIAARALSRGLAVTPLVRYRRDTDGRSGFVLSYANVTERSMAEAVSLLASTLRTD